MAQRGTEITPDQVVGFALTQAVSSPLGGVSIQTGTNVVGADAQTGQLLVFTNAFPSTYLLPTTTSGLWTTSIVAGGAGTLTLSPPTGTTLNGSTSLITIPAGGGAILYSDGAGNFRALVLTSASSGTPATPILDADGDPISDADGSWIFEG
jgi:hypothetical protein